MTDAATLAVSTLSTGDPSRVPVVLVHGFATSAATDFPADDWATALPGRTVIAVDLPAHGASPSLGTAPTTAWLEALADVVRPLGEADVVAYSLGARLAWDLAARDGVRVRRLVLGGLSPVEPFGAVDLAGARAALADGTTPTDPLTALILGMAQTAPDPAALLDAVEGLAAEPFDAAAHPPAVPVLLVGGTDDAMAAGIDGLAAGLADAEVRRVPGDHVGALRGAAFRDAAREFLDR